MVKLKLKLNGHCPFKILPMVQVWKPSNMHFHWIWQQSSPCILFLKFNRTVDFALFRLSRKILLYFVLFIFFHPHSFSTQERAGTFVPLFCKSHCLINDGHPNGKCFLGFLCFSPPQSTEEKTFLSGLLLFVPDTALSTCMVSPWRAPFSVFYVLCRILFFHYSARFFCPTSRMFSLWSAITVRSFEPILTFFKRRIKTYNRIKYVSKALSLLESEKVVLMG